MNEENMWVKALPVLVCLDRKLAQDNTISNNSPTTRLSITPCSIFSEGDERSSHQYYFVAQIFQCYRRFHQANSTFTRKRLIQLQP